MGNYCCSHPRPLNSSDSTIWYLGLTKDRHQIATYLHEYNVLLNHVPLLMQLESELSPETDKDVLASVKVIKEIVAKHVRMDKAIK
jgi:hypothetical protein